MQFNKNPAVYISLIAAGLALAIGFGVRISGTQSELILNFVNVLIPLIIGGAGVAIRSQVYNADSAQTALDMPAGSSTTLLDRVIEAGVNVNAGDTKTEIVNKIKRATEITLPN